MYIEKCLKIINKEGQLVPFKLYAGQIIVDNIIKEGSAKARKVAQQTLAEVRKLVRMY